MTRRCCPVAGLLAVLAVLLVAPASFASRWDRFPELPPGQHFAVKKRFDGPKYDDLRRCYRRFDSRVGAEYYGTMIDVTSETGSRSPKKTNARPFADALYKAWKDDGALDGGDDVVVALGLQNHSIAIRPGPKWKKLGFDGEVIDDTIEASHFHKHRRRRNYTEALCSLANAVDLRLASLQQRMDKRIARLHQRLPALDKKLSALRHKVDQRFEEGHPYGDELLARLAAARTDLDEATSLLEKQPRRAVRLADQVHDVLQPVRAELETFEQDMSHLDAIERQLAQLKAAIHQRPDVQWDEPQAALIKLAACKQKADHIRHEYDAKPWEVRDCLRAAEVRLGKADVRYFYLRTVLPTVLIIALVVFLIGFVVVRRLRRRRALDQLGSDLGRWRRGLDDAGRQLTQLERQCPAYFASGRRPWEGQSAEADRRVADAVNLMFLLVANGRDIVHRADALADKSHSLDASHLEEALAVMRDTPVTLPAGHTDPRQPIAVPLGDSYDRTAADLLGDLARAGRRARQNLDEIAQVTGRLSTHSARASEAVTAASRAVAERRDLGLACDHLTESLLQATSSWQTATRLAHRDPRQAADLFERAAGALDSVATRAETGNQVIRRLQGPLAELGGTLDQKIRQLRFARVDLDGLSFDPKRQLANARRQAAAIVDSVAFGREDQASESIESLQALLDRLAHRLEIAGKAAERIPKRARTLSDRGKAVKKRLMEMRYTLQSLPDEAHQQAYRAASQKVGKYQTRINRLPNEIAEVKADHAADHYLIASAKLDAITRLLDDAEALLDDLDHIGRRVESSREETLELVQTCQPLADKLRAHYQSSGASPALQSVVSEHLVSFQMLRDRVQAGDVNWLDAAGQLRALHQALAFLDAEVRADLDAYRQAQKLAERLETHLSELDRAEASARCRQMLADVQQMLAGWTGQLQEGAAGGCTLLGTGRRVARACGRAADAVTGELPLDLLAGAQLAYARSRYADVHARAYGYDVFGDCSHVADQLDEASAALEAGHPAAALELSEAAIEQIELEDARAVGAAEHEYRTTRVDHIVNGSNDSDLPRSAVLGNQTSWTKAVATLGEPSAAGSVS